jgi:predicted AAA+ superfamily ATPase
MYRHRALEARLNRYLTLFPAVAVTGPRQSGKSTLLRTSFPDVPYATFDDPEEVRAVESDPKGYLARFPDRVILDEVQRVPALFSYLKIAIDTDRQRKGRFLLTGSSQFTQSRRISESLAGRIGLLELFPFERREMPADARPGQMLFGSYPELAMRGHDGSREWFSAYLATYLERDIRVGNNVGKLSDFQTLLRLLAARTSQEYNASSLAREVGVDSKTVESWVSILEASYQVFRLRPWKADIGKRFVKRPKLYFWDTGLVCHLTGIRSMETLEAGPLAGPVFENLVIAEILKAVAHRGVDVEAHYFRESNGLEADLLIQDRDHGRFLVVDTKAGRTAKAPWVDSLKKVAALVGAKLKRQPRPLIIYQGRTQRDWPSKSSDFLSMEDAIAQWQAPAGS